MPLLAQPSSPSQVSPAHRWAAPVSLLVVGLLLFGSALLGMWSHRLPLEVTVGAKALKDKHPEEARRAFEAAIIADRNNPAVYLAIHEVVSNEQQWEMATEFDRRGVAQCASLKQVKSPVRAQLYNDLAMSLSRWKSANWKAESLDMAERAQREDAGSPAICVLYGSLLAESNDDEGTLGRAENLVSSALRDLSTRGSSAEIELESSLAQASYGWIRLKRGDASSAVSVLTEALAKLPATYRDTANLSEIYTHLGIAYEKLGQPSQAGRAFETALVHNAANNDALEGQKRLLSGVPKPKAAVSPLSSS